MYIVGPEKNLFQGAASAHGGTLPNSEAGFHRPGVPGLSKRRKCGLQGPPNPATQKTAADGGSAAGGDRHRTAGHSSGRLPSREPVPSQMAIRFPMTDHGLHRLPPSPALLPPPGYEASPRPGPGSGSLTLAMSPIPAVHEYLIHRPPRPASHRIQSGLPRWSVIRIPRPRHPAQEEVAPVGGGHAPLDTEFVPPVGLALADALDCRAWATRFARSSACGPLRASRWHRFTRRHARGFPVPLVRSASIVAGRAHSAPAVPMRGRNRVRLLGSIGGWGGQ